MREPAFWRTDAGLAAALLAPFAAAYGGIAAWRMRRPGRRAGVPVICVGNLTLGGAGKTPTAIAIAGMLQQAGARPAILTRGYGGRLAGPLAVEPRRHDAAAVGDEPLLLADVAPTIVARDRFAGALFAEQQGASVIVMDDGLQNPSLAKDLRLVVVDGRRGIGNGRVFPAGPLRAPLGAQLAQADAMLVLGPVEDARVVAATAGRGVPVFHGRLVPDAQAVDALVGRRVLAFAGIGDPDKFFATLADAGVAVAMRRSFPDHHRYAAAELETLRRDAERDGLALVTTAKDRVRLAAHPDFARAVAVLPVTLALDQSEAFERLMLSALRRTRD